MVYYTDNSEMVKIDLNEKDILGTGCQGAVYKHGDNQCIKFYFSEQPRGLGIYTKEMFDTFKKLDLENFCKLHDLIYRDPKKTLIGAYTMDYYEKTDKSILDMPMEYIIHNFDILFKNAQILSKHKIVMHDLILKNIIVGDENITVIDFEAYYRRKFSCTSNVLRQNTLILLKLMKSLYNHELKKYNLNNDYAQVLLEDLFSYSEEPVKTLKKKMGSTKKSIDLF